MYSYHRANWSSPEEFNWALLACPLVAFLCWPGTVIVTSDEVTRNRVGRIWRTSLRWVEIARIEYRWQDRWVHGWGLLLSIEGMNTRLYGTSGSSVVHRAHNEGMLEFDKLLREHLPAAVFPESQAQLTHS